MPRVMDGVLTGLSPLSRALKRHSRLYRRLHAYGYVVKDRFRERGSYSQFGEDRIVQDLLTKAGGIRKGWVYVDVGANHPTTISDTYLFYRQGFSGICLEPNRELAALFRAVRPRDTVLNAAAGNRQTVMKLYETENPVFSSLLEDGLEDRVARSYLVPVVRLSDLVPCLEAERVFLLKIDTEGFDQEVLEGATALLERTMILLTETRSDAEREQRAQVLGPRWRTVHARSNTIFVNGAFCG